MGSISDFLEAELLDHVFNAAYTPPTTTYLALFESDPTDADTGTETTYTGYSRQSIAFNAAASRQVVQNGQVSFPQSTGGDVTITHWAVFDASSAGNMLAHGALGTSKNVVSGNTPTVADGEVSVSIDAGEVSDYLANNLLDFAFRNAAFAQPDTHVGLTTATIADSDDGTTITEVSGGSYGRVQVNPNGGATPTWALASGVSPALVDNVDQIDFPTPTGAWGTVVAAFIADAGTGGNLLFYDNDQITDQAVGSGDSVNFPAGDLDATLS